MEGSFEMSARVLVVDDESAIREAIRTTLEYEGYEVDESRSGQEALELLGREAWDVILLDIKMPDIDGLTVLGSIKQNNKNLPVILLTAYHTFKQDFHSWAADEYVVKQSDFTELKEKISKHI